MKRELLKSVPDVKAVTSPREASTVADVTIDEVVTELNEMLRRAGVDLALRMGKLIVERFYGGDMTAWREHRTKETSFRRLARRADCDLRVSAVGLYRAVAVYELTERLELMPGSHLGTTHLRAVLGLPDDVQLTLLRTADDMKWTAVRLEREAARARSQRVQRVGRTPQPAVMRATRALAKTWQELKDSYDAGGSHEERLMDLPAVYRALEEIREGLSLLLRRMSSNGRPLGPRRLASAPPSQLE
jgi:hypothetical protein